MGGRRRRTAKGKGKKGMRGGGYGFGGPLGTNGAVWNSVENLAATPAGNLLPNNGSELVAAPLVGGRRRRRTGKGKKVTRKGGRKGRRSTRRRTMRGGASYVGSANVGYGYAGRGSGGLADPAGYAANVPGGSGTQVNGVWQTS